MMFRKNVVWLISILFVVGLPTLTNRQVYAQEALSTIGDAAVEQAPEHAAVSDLIAFSLELAGHSVLAVLAIMVIWKVSQSGRKRAEKIAHSAAYCCIFLAWVITHS